MSPVTTNGSPKSSEATVEYYNMFVPQLPANTSEPTQVLGLRNKFESKPPHALSSMTPSSSSEPVAEDVDSVQPDSSEHDYSRFNRIDSHPTDQVNYITDPNYSSLHQVQGEVRALVDHNYRDHSPEVGASAVAPASMYDKLEIRSPSKSPCFSPVPMQDQRDTSPRPGCYDTLAPIENDVGVPKPQQVYDSLLPYRDASSKSSSSSPEPTLLPPNLVNKSFQYNRKVKVLQHRHMYEYIDVESEDSSSNEGGRDLISPTQPGPVSLEHPSEWMVNPAVNGGMKHTDKIENGSKNDLSKRSPSVQSKGRFSRKSTNSQSRKKHLPLQEKNLDESPVEQGSPAMIQKPRAPKMTREKSRNSKSPSSSPKAKPKPLPRKTAGSDKQKTAQDSNELHSSLDSYSSSHRESVLSNDSVSSFEMIIDSLPTSSLPLPSRENSKLRRSVSPPQRSISCESNPPKIKSIQVEIAQNVNGSTTTDHSAPPIPPRNDNSSTSSDHLSTSDYQAPPPVIPRRYVSEEGKVDTPPVPHRSKDQCFTVPLPRAEFDFEKPQSVTKPKVLLGHDPHKYVALAFSNYDKSEQSLMSPEYTEVTVNHSRPTVTVVSDHNSTAGERIPYASVDFKRTIGLQATIEQVEDKKRGFIDHRR